MFRKIIKYIVMILVIIILLMIALVFKPDKTENTNSINEDKTDEKQVIDVLSFEEDNNVIGYITIQELGIEKAPIAEGTDNKTIGKYIGHFVGTSYLDGNIVLCSHNRGSKATFFENLKNAEIGMRIEYMTKYETKTYMINEIKEIEETDFSILNSTEDNRITLVTCVENQREKRLCVVGGEI